MQNLLESVAMKLALDMHVHTHHSACSCIAPRDMEACALKKGLDAVAITDHNTLRGALEVRSAAKTIHVIIGEEIMTDQGELTGYFLNSTIPPYLSPERTIEAIKQQGGLVAVPHPFDRLRSSRITLGALGNVIEHIDMIETFNSRDILTKTDASLLRKALENGAVSIVGSDAHSRTEVGRARMMIDAFNGPAEFIRCLASAETVCRKSPFWVHIVTKALKARNKRRKNRPQEASPSQ